MRVEVLTKLADVVAKQASIQTYTAVDGCHHC
jgi:hypothetical protein